MFLRCVAVDEALEKQKKENAELKRKVDNAQAAMMELTQENQSLQVCLKKNWRCYLYKISRIVINQCQARGNVTTFFARENMKSVSSATGAMRGKRENVQPVWSAEEHDPGVKRGKTWTRCQARENVIPVSSAEEREPGVKRGKTCNWCHARENMEAVSSAGKHATGVLRGKLHVCLSGLILIWPLIDRKI